MSLTKATYSMISGEIVNVLDFGAYNDGTNATATTAAIQAAIDYAATKGDTIKGSVVFFPAGKYAINSDLIITANSFAGFMGEGKASQLCWSGGDSGKLLYFNGSTDTTFFFIEKLTFTRSASQPYVYGVYLNPSTGGICINVSIRKNYFVGIYVAIQAWNECDSITIAENWILGCGSAGNGAIQASNGTCSNWFIENNHIQGCPSQSYGIVHGGGANIVISKNSIQSGDNAKGIYLSGVSVFRVSDTYSEFGGAYNNADGPFLSLQGCSTGVVENNYTGGNVGDSIYDVSATTSNVVFGPNRHAISGGYPTIVVAIDPGATGISILGEQRIEYGVSPVITVAPYSGTPLTYLGQSGSIFSSIPLAINNSFANISSASNVVAYTATAGQGYLVTAKQTSDNYVVCGLVLFTGSTGQYTQLARTNVNFDISVVGLDIKLTNGTGVTRTAEWSIQRIL